VAIAIFYRSRLVGLLFDVPTMRKNLRRLPALIGSDFRSTREQDFSKRNAMKTKYLAVSVSLVLAFVVFLPQAEAVVPPPDGGYPGFALYDQLRQLQH
jgi:hypothetical protein